MTQRIAFSFDGCGINDATDPYRPRIATLTRRDAIDAGAPGRGYRLHGELMTAAPRLLALAREFEDYLRRTGTGADTLTSIHRILAPFEGVE